MSVRKPWSGVVVVDVTDKTTNQNAEDILRDIIAADAPAICNGEMTAAQRASEFERLFRYQKGVDELVRETEAARRVAGANKTNAMQSRAAANFRKHWLARYRALRADGLSRKRAIDRVDEEMIAAGKMRSRAWLYRNLTDS